MLPCQSRWSWLRFSTTAAVGSRPLGRSSWKLESSSTQISGRASSARALVSVSNRVGPILPATATLFPAQRTRWPVSEVTVVLPLVPVMASTFGAYSAWMVGTALCARSSSACANRLSSPPTHRPRVCAASITPTVSAGLRPGLLKTARMELPSISEALKSECTKRTSGSSWRSTASCGGASRVSTTVTTAPCNAHQRTMARPDAPKPRTMTWRPCRLCMTSLRRAAPRRRTAPLGAEQLRSSKRGGKHV